MAAFLKERSDRTGDRFGSSDYALRGKWNASGCLTHFLLENPRDQMVGLTKAQVAGAVDGKEVVGFRSVSSIVSRVNGCY